LAHETHFGVFRSIIGAANSHQLLLMCLAHAQNASNYFPKNRPTFKQKGFVLLPALHSLLAKSDFVLFLRAFVLVAVDKSK